MTRKASVRGGTAKGSIRKMWPIAQWGRVSSDKGHGKAEVLCIYRQCLSSGISGPSAKQEGLEGRKNNPWYRKLECFNKLDIHKSMVPCGPG